MVLSYMHKAIKALNQLRTMEDALVIYRLSRAPERRIWYIDVGNLPKMKAEQHVRDINEVVRLVREQLPTLALTVDPVEFRGLDYQTGISFTVFSRSVAGELGRGGRYVLGNGEPATGATLFLEQLIQAAAPVSPTRTLYLPFGTTPAARAKLHADGWRPHAALERDADPAAAAKQRGCTHIFAEGQARAL